MGVVLVNIISELSSIICLLLFIPNKKINLHELKPDKNILKDILNISISTTGSKFIGSISYFLEPILLTHILLKCGYSNSDIVKEYGIITGYVFPLLLIPSFFTMAISTSLLPVVSSALAKGNIAYSKKKLKEAIGISLIIGIISTITFVLIPDTLLKLIYNTEDGTNYLKLAAPLFIMHYIQGPLTSYMQGAGLAKEAMFGTLKGTIIKNLLLITLPLKFGMLGLIIANITNIFYVTIHHISYINKVKKASTKLF